MHVEQTTGKPGKVVVLEVPGVGKIPELAGAATAAVVRHSAGRGVISVKLTQDRIYVRTVEEMEDLYGWGLGLELVVKEVATDYSRT